MDAATVKIEKIFTFIYISIVLVEKKTNAVIALIAKVMITQDAKEFQFIYLGITLCCTTALFHFYPRNPRYFLTTTKILPPRLGKDG
tara:strand:- start:334 stop:594 length:261 start_codon:yes stop_codon:yes gene_type:complete